MAGDHGSLHELLGKECLGEVKPSTFESPSCRKCMDSTCLAPKEGNHGRKEWRQTLRVKRHGLGSSVQHIDRRIR